MRTRVVWTIYPLLMFCVAFVATSQARVDDAGWKSIKSQFQQQWVTDKPRAVQALGRANRIEAVKMLVNLLGWKDSAGSTQMRQRNVLLAKIDQFLRAAAKNDYKVTASEKQRFDKMQAQLASVHQSITASNFVRFAAIGALSKTTDEESLGYLHTTGLDNPRWEVSAGVLIALGKAGHSSSKPFVRHKISDSDPMVGSSAIDASSQLDDRAALDAIHKALDSRYWQVRTSAASALGKFKSIQSVGPLVQSLQQQKGRLQQDFDEALRKITGYSFGGHPASWKSWYETNQNRLQEVIAQKAKQQDKKEGGRTTTFYGIEIRSNRICFILDVSGSMSQKAGRARGDLEISGTGGKGKQDKYPVNGTKLDVAKYELKKALRGLSKKVKYNIITFNHKLQIYSNSMVSATSSAKNRSRAWVHNLKPDGGTNIFDALYKGFNLAGSSLKRNYKAGVDTIFFLTDGVPTAGRIKDTAKILTELGMRNKLRKIKIHVIGVGKAGELDLDFLKKLATQNKGSFVHRD